MQNYGKRMTDKVYGFRIKLPVLWNVGFQPFLAVLQHPVYAYRRKDNDLPGWKSDNDTIGYKLPDRTV